VTLLVWLLASCVDPDAPEKCEVMLDAICNNVADQCGLGMSADECRSEVDAVVSCDDAVRLGEGYDSCLDLVETTGECLPMNALPAECVDAVYGIE
jgi:hypothetical protein